MQWVRRFQLFLFDFDGLLVNTEPMHYQAYLRMLAARARPVDWNFATFCELAHKGPSNLKEAIYAQHPDLDPNWPVLYTEKQAIYRDLIEEGATTLMPGVEPLLQKLASENIARCVVTNSTREQAASIRAKLPALQSLPHWITREDYANPKPDPECYSLANERFAPPGAKAIGFEDSLRGIQALQGTTATAVLICPATHPLRHESDAVHFASFDAIPSDWEP